MLYVEIIINVIVKKCVCLYNIISYIFLIVILVRSGLSIPCDADMGATIS